MIVVKIELWSARTGETTEIGRMIIANVGGSDTRGDYDVRVGRRGLRGEDRIKNEVVWIKPQRTGAVKGHPRLSQSVWCLVAKALHASGFGKPVEEEPDRETT